MSSELQNMIQLLKSQLGYGEQGGGYTKFGDWYGNTVEFDSDYSAQPWCDMFLSWAAHRLGYDKWFGQFAYTVDHAKWFIGHGAWGDAPKPGAVVFYDWGGSGVVDGIDHVGMVTSVDGGTIHTIEGNIDGGYVREKARDQSFVVGYGYPEKVQAAMAAATTATAPPTGAPPLALTLTAAKTPLGDPSGGLGPAQPGLGVLTAPVLIAALLLIACRKVTHLPVRLAHASTRPPGHDAYGGRDHPAGGNALSAIPAVPTQPTEPPERLRTGRT